MARTRLSEFQVRDEDFLSEDEASTISGALQAQIDAKPDTFLGLTDTPPSYDVGKYIRSTASGIEWSTVSGTSNGVWHYGNGQPQSSIGEADDFYLNSINNDVYKKSVSGSSGRMVFTIDGSKIEGDLTNFPVLLTLSSGTGINNYDTTDVFDVLGSNDNRKKIRITDESDNQLYVEIERWDHDNEEAFLWIKIPTISSGTNTNFYLYYDSTISDNTTYVGDILSTPAKNVWDDDFVGVWHMSQNPNGDVNSAIKDSTSNTNHGTPAGAMTTADLVDGQIGKGIEFDGAGDFINMGDTATLRQTGAITLEAIVDPPSNSTYRIVGKNNATSNKSTYHLTWWNQYIGINVSADGTNIVDVSSDQYSDANRHYVAGTYDPSTSLKVYVDEAIRNTKTIGIPASLNSNDSNFKIAALDTDGNYFSGLIDEVRVSKIDRQPEWLKATYYSNWDNLLTATYSGSIWVNVGNLPTEDLQTQINAKPDTLLELTDTPSSYDNEKYMRSTASGTEWATIAGGGLTWTIVSGTSVNCVKDIGYLINASNNDIILHLPTTPSEGDTVGFCDFKNKASTNTITISGSSNIEGDSSTLSLNINGAGFELVYTDVDRGWEIVSEIGNVANNSPAYVKVSDVKAYNVHGGTFTQDAWRTRDINTEDSDASSICSISTNQITLEAGTYVCNIKVPAYAINTHKAILYNITDASVELLGTEGVSVTDATGWSFITGQFTIATQKTFEIRDYCTVTCADYGFGVRLNLSGYNSVYTIAEFWRQ